MKYFLALFALLISCISVKAQILSDGKYQVVMYYHYPEDEEVSVISSQKDNTYLLFDGLLHSIILYINGYATDILKYDPKSILKSDDGSSLMIFGADKDLKRNFLICINRETDVCEFWIQHINGTFSILEVAQ